MAEQIAEFLHTFEKNITDPLLKRGLYVMGGTGVGKTTLVKNTLLSLHYDYVYYNSGDVRNKSTVTKYILQQTSKINVFSMMSKCTKKVAIIMDDIDGMVGGGDKSDKGGISAIVALIRPKKTKKQKKDPLVTIPVICIGTHKSGKKLDELKNICHSISIPTPTFDDMRPLIVKQLTMCGYKITDKLIEQAYVYTQGDLRRITHFAPNVLNNMYCAVTMSDNKRCTQQLFTNCHPLSAHSDIINETDRTSVGLLWHENVIKPYLAGKAPLPFYIQQLNRICKADVMDRIMFQRQVWQLNEISSIIKTFHNHYSYHTAGYNYAVNTIDFTKILTKFSTEYHNILFIQHILNVVKVDKKDLIHMVYGGVDLSTLFSKLEITRLQKYVNKYIYKSAIGLKDVAEESDDDDLFSV